VAPNLTAAAKPAANRRNQGLGAFSAATSAAKSPVWARIFDDLWPNREQRKTRWRRGRQPKLGETATAPKILKSRRVPVLQSKTPRFGKGSVVLYRLSAYWTEDGVQGDRELLIVRFPP
jgi:hypothetical protein